MGLENSLEALSRSFDGSLYWDALHKGLYATDASVYRKLPLAVAYPKSETAIKQLITFAKEEQTSLIPRTAGTSLAGQCVGEGIVVDVSKYFTSIINLDSENKQVTVQPGVIRDELNTYLKSHNLFFAPNTSTSNRCMIGGMVGNNSSGTTSIKYGVTRDKVVALKAILHTGETVLFEDCTKETFLQKSQQNTTEGQIYKELLALLSPKDIQKDIQNAFPKKSIHRRNTGYAVDALLDTAILSQDSQRPFNFSKLLCGSEGTLAFITEITLQLDELPPTHEAMITTQYLDLQDCMEDVVEVMQHPLYACELMDEVILNCTQQNKTYEPYRFFIKGNPKAVLLLELRAHSQEALELEISKLQQTLTNSKRCDHQAVLRGNEIEMAMELRKAGLGLLGNMIGDRKAVACIEDTAVALEDLPAYIKDFGKLMQRHNQEAVYYAHAGAGELHLRPILNLKKKEDVLKFRQITEDVAQLVKKYNGSLSGEHGDGIVRAEFLKMQVGESVFELLRKIKTVFDPENIFNPGKITDAWPMDESLRYEVDRMEPHVTTFMDFEDSEGILRLSEKCNGSGDCRKTEKSAGMLCPSYHATKNEKDTTRGRANILREVLTQNPASNKFDDATLHEAFDLCVSCKACATECPSNVDMATAKSEFLYQYQKSHPASRRTKLFAQSTHYYKKASQFPVLYNGLVGNSITASIVKGISGIAKQRSIPNICLKSFAKKNASLPKIPNPEEIDVLLWVDEFSNYLDASIAQDAYELLLALGYRVGVVTHLDSARALISKGFLKEAKSHVDTNISFLQTYVSHDIPILGIEPSAILGVRDEYLRLTSHKIVAQEVAKQCFLIEEFLASEAPKHNWSSLFTEEHKELKIHVHCHQKALSQQKSTFDILNLPINYRPVLIPSGCCGMAGSFGYEKEHYEVSMKIGETKLFPTLRKTPSETIIVANGTSCRHQILDGVQRKALHPVTVLRKALKAKPS